MHLNFAAKYYNFFIVTIGGKETIGITTLFNFPFFAQLFNRKREVAGCYMQFFSFQILFAFFFLIRDNLLNIKTTSVKINLTVCSVQMGMLMQFINPVKMANRIKSSGFKYGAVGFVQILFG